MATLVTDVKRDWNVIGVVALAHGTSHFFHMLVPALFPWIRPEFGLSFTALGALTAIFYGVSSVGQALAGFVVDRFGALRTLLFGLLCLALAGPVLAMANSYVGLAIAAALAGVGNSVFHPADFTLINRGVGERRLGHAFSAHGVAGNLGWAAAPMFMLTLVPALGWRGAAAATSLIALAAVALLLISRSQFRDGAPVRPALAGAATDAPVNTAEILKNASIWLSFVFFLASVAAFGALQNFAPAVLKALYGLDLNVAQAALTTYLLVAAGGLILGGFLANGSRSPERLIAVVMGLAALASALLATGFGGTPAVFTGMVLIGVAIGLAGPSRDLLVRRATLAGLGKSAYGRVYGFVYSGLDVGLALSPIVFGWLLDHGMARGVLIGVAALQIVALSTALAVAKLAPTGART